jgi:hypothetical protein
MVVKQPGIEADHSPLTSIYVEKTCIYASTSPYVFMASRQGQFYFTNVPYLRIEELRDLYSSPSIIRIMKPRMMSGAEHVARMGEKRNPYRLLLLLLLLLLLTAIGLHPVEVVLPHYIK